MYSLDNVLTFGLNTCASGCRLKIQRAWCSGKKRVLNILKDSVSESLIKNKKKIRKFVTAFGDLTGRLGNKRRKDSTKET